MESSRSERLKFIQELQEEPMKANEVLESGPIIMLSKFDKLEKRVGEQIGDLNLSTNKVAESCEELKNTCSNHGKKLNKLQEVVEKESKYTRKVEDDLNLRISSLTNKYDEDFHAVKKEIKQLNVDIKVIDDRIDMQNKTVSKEIKDLKKEVRETRTEVMKEIGGVIKDLNTMKVEMNTMKDDLNLKMNIMNGELRIMNAGMNSMNEDVNNVIVELQNLKMEVLSANLLMQKRQEEMKVYRIEREEEMKVYRIERQEEKRIAHINMMNEIKSLIEEALIKKKNS